MSRYKSAREELAELKIALIYFVVGNLSMGFFWLCFHFYGV